jgi:hypothetical protein
VVIRIPCALFWTEEEHEQLQRTNAALKIEELWSETQQTWVNVSDAYIFLEADGDAMVPASLSSTTFIWSSELSGYRHLYYVTKSDKSDTPTIQQLTSGDWCVIDKPIHVDQKRQLVYFMAKMDTPLESHLYVTTYGGIYDTEQLGQHRQHRPIRRLTSLGYSHSVEISPTFDIFIDQASCLHQPNGVVIRRLLYNEDDPLPTANDQYSYGHALNSDPSNNNGIAALMPAMTDIGDINDGDTDMQFHNLVIARPSRPSSPNSNTHTDETKAPEQHQHGGYPGSTPHSLTTVNILDQQTSAIPKGQIFDFTTSDGKM